MKIHISDKALRVLVIVFFVYIILFSSCLIYLINEKSKTVLKINKFMRIADKLRHRKKAKAQENIENRNKLLKPPENNIPVNIRPGLTVWVDHKSKIEKVKLKYRDK